ncbi:MAG: GAF domain-containing SpoIIE family protein phosphatase [Nitrospirota bacterium]
MTKRDKVTVERDYLKNIEKKVEDLKMLMEVSAIISSTLDFNDLMTIVMEKAKNVMDADACSILLYNKEINKLEFEVAICREGTTSEILKKHVTLDIGEGIAGWVAGNLKPLIIEDAKADARFSAEADRQTGFTTKSLIAVPLIGRGGLIGVAEILNPKHKKYFDDYDLDIFQTLCRQVAIAIENSIFHRESIERERIRQELELASTLQRSFLPDSPVFKKGVLKVSAINISARHVGGDIYDFTEPVEGKVGVFIGDISGKGISAALYMAKIVSDFRYLSRLMEYPDVVLNLLNSQMANAPRGMFLTAIYMIADIVTGNVHISVAGHPPFLWFTKGEVRVMNVRSGPPLGIMPVEYPVTTISLERGDRVLLLTDGVFEAKNKENERIGFNNIVEFYKKNISHERLVEIIADYVKDFSRGVEPADDLTLVEIGFR